MKALLLDSHVVVWLAANDRKLGRNSRRLIAQATSRSRALVSAVSFWEVALLALRDDIEIGIEISAWRERLLAEGLRELPLRGEAAIRGAQAMPYHQDPCDRMLIGSALVEEAEFLTADEKLLAWKGLLKRHDARH